MVWGPTCLTLERHYLYEGNFQNYGIQNNFVKISMVRYAVIAIQTSNSQIASFTANIHIGVCHFHTIITSAPIFHRTDSSTVESPSLDSAKSFPIFRFKIVSNKAQRITWIHNRDLIQLNEKRNNKKKKNARKYRCILHSILMAD